jgi:hypothetical protein
MHEGKEVFWKGCNSEGRARIVGERGDRRMLVDIGGTWKLVSIAAEIDHKFFEICKPAKLDFCTKLSYAVPVGPRSVGLVFSYDRIEDFERFKVGAEVHMNIEEL